MSDRRRHSYDEYIREPIVIERSPRVRTYRVTRRTSPEPERLTLGEKIYSLFRRRKKTVRIIEEAPVRSRRQEPRIRSSSPSPPRGQYRTMSSHYDDGVYAPLPPKLPPKPQHPDDEIGYVVQHRSPRYHGVKVIHEPLRGEDEHPRVESGSPGRKRDSGKYYVESSRFEDGTHRRPEYERHRPDPEVQRLSDNLAKEKRERRDAEEKANRLQADLEHERHRRSLEQREYALAEREKRLREERDQLVQVRRPGEHRQDVVVIHNTRRAAAAAQQSNHHRPALDRAQDDFWRNRRENPVREERRPATATGAGGDRRSHRHSIVIVDDDRGYHGRR